MGKLGPRFSVAVSPFFRSRLPSSTGFWEGASGGYFPRGFCKVGSEASEANGEAGFRALPVPGRLRYGEFPAWASYQFNTGNGGESERALPLVEPKLERD